jgi:hypothetical protein
MSLRPKRLGSSVRDTIKAAKAKLTKRKEQASKMRKSLLEGKLAQTLSKAQKSSAGGLSRSGVAVLKILRERGHTERGHTGGKKESLSDGGGIGGTGPDIPVPKGVIGDGHKTQYPLIHLTKKKEKEGKPKAKHWSKGDEKAKRAWRAAFQSPERQDWGISADEIRFRRALIKMWFEYQQRLRKSKGNLSPAESLVYEAVLSLVIEIYGEPTYVEER